MSDRYTWRKLALEVGMIVAAAIFVVPLYLLIVTAFKSPSETSSPFAPPSAPTFENFVTAWEQGNLPAALANSVIVTVASVLLLVVTSSLAAYPLARITQGWSRGAYLAFLFGLMLPIQLSLIPVYLAMRNVGLTGTLLGIILVYGGLQMPFCIFLYVEFLRSVPRDYDEAASIDGAGHFRTFVHVLLPMLRPITGTVVVLNSVMIWNDFYMPLLYLSGTGNQTLPVAIYGFVGAWTSQWNVIFAALILAALPVLVVFMLMQKAVFRGYSSGLKG
ncbi:raffinose/stachyose/melibiose transport system permease protein [Microbacterium sp. W4I4]|uniref:carbohydrate ABC transporter permease n=1 Tax=Microbacterium sp. W4I4 TaxID=3042295 RepID=UPI002782609A|nr:carbohydrate ABC transporter permease [Microbacterium sp. W4I4]MDQ0615351.1 raffinose/stachyose/melibiose transport system permease protein [Microbacterium sp. W4I4]